MKSLYTYLLSLIGGIFIISIISCQKELTKINKNPNAVENPEPGYLLSGAIKTTSDTYWTVSGSNPSNLFVQYWAALHYTDEDRYIFSSNSFQGFWTTLYSKSIVNLDKIISLAQEQEHVNFEGVALILRSWNYSLLTDAFGNIPYSEASQINKISAPKYDTQKEVYEGLLNDLERAEKLLDSNGKPIDGDLIYNGDIRLWKKLANSFRLRIALRIADQEPEKAKSVVNEINSTEENFINSNIENAQLTYLSSPNDNPLTDMFLTRDDYRISQTIVDKLTALKDPRLAIYADPTKDPDSEDYIGVPNGLLNGDASDLGASKTSKPGAYFLTPDGSAIILSYAEVLFNRAEAAARGFTHETPSDLYAQAITASLKQYGIEQNEINDYLAQPGLEYAENNFRKSIGEQKWIALFGQGLEAFVEWRRLDYPKLQPAVAGVLEGKMPRRFTYPGTEQSLNQESYQKSIKQQGEDLLTTQLWFDLK